MKKFESEGNFRVTIVDAALAKARFADEPAVDVVLTVRDAEGHQDDWRGEVSDRYGRGNHSDKMQSELTHETLARLGYQFGEDLSELETLVGIETEVWVVESESKGKTYFNIKSIGSSVAKELIPKDQIKARLEAIYGRPVVRPSTAPAPAAANPAKAATAPAPAAAAAKPAVKPVSAPVKTPAVNPYA